VIPHDWIAPWPKPPNERILFGVKDEGLGVQHVISGNDMRLKAHFVPSAINPVFPRTNECLQ